MTDWILILENSHFEYEVEIPEEEYQVRIDIKRIHSYYQQSFTKYNCS